MYAPDEGTSLGMPFQKPEGGWTGRAGLATDDVSYRDSTDSEFHTDEIEAVFRRSWLNVGRDIEIPEAGDYFTRQLPGLNVSLLIARGRDDVVRAFYNMCTHRGNKLVWEDDPKAEVCGNARRLQCKYHGWQFDLEGDLRFVNKEKWFFDFDKTQYGLVPVACEIWETFIFVNLEPNPSTTLREHLGPIADGLAGYPFDKMTQVFKFQCESQSNWKLFLDANIETYHGNTLHHKLVDQTSVGPLRGAVGMHFEMMGENWISSSAVPVANLDAPFRPARPMEELFEANLWGPANHPELVADELPPLVNPVRHPDWSNGTTHVFPNFEVLIWKRQWILVYTFWPVAVNRMLFDGRMYFPEPRNASDRLAQELTAVEFKEFLLQDANLVEAAQSMLELNIKDNFPLCDEEVAVRKTHDAVQVRVRKYRDEKARVGA